MRQRLIKGALPSALTLAVILGAAGCGKKAAQGTAPAPTTATEAPVQQSQPSPQAQPTTQAQANNEPDLAELNRSLIRWIVSHKKRPANFEEFAATAGAPIPPPPAGKKYILATPPRIQLVNQ